MTWNIWRVHYVRYDEITDMAAFMAGRYLPPELVAHGLTLDEAQARVAQLGFGYCVKPS